MNIENQLQIIPGVPEESDIKVVPLKDWPNELGLDIDGDIDPRDGKVIVAKEIMDRFQTVVVK